MPAKQFNVEFMLSAAFTKAELDFLKASPRFAEALPLVTTLRLFERLCAIGEELLEAAIPEVKQFLRS